MDHGNKFTSLNMDLSLASRTQEKKARRQAKNGIGIVIGNTYYVEFHFPNDIWTHVIKYLDKETLFDMRFVNKYLWQFISGYHHIGFEQCNDFNEVVKHTNTGQELCAVFNAIDDLRKSDDVAKRITDRESIVSIDFGDINIHNWRIIGGWKCRHCMQSRIFSIDFSADFKQVCWSNSCRKVCYKCGEPLQPWL